MKKGILLFTQGDGSGMDETSAKAVEILKKSGVPYRTYDITKSENLQTALTEYAELDFLPQLWVDSNLIAGFPLLDEDYAWLSNYGKEKPKTEEKTMEIPSSSSSSSSQSASPSSTCSSSTSNTCTSTSPSTMTLVS